MPPEIADSDAESEGPSPKRPAYSPLEENGHLEFPMNLEDPDPIETLNFSQYLSPTQRLSSMLEQQDLPPRGTGSTDQFLKEIGPAQDGVFDSTTTGLDGSMDLSAKNHKQKKAKRTFSDIENSSSGKLLDEDVRRGATKRTKTYGHSRSHVSPPSSSLFSNTEDLAHHTTNENANEEIDIASAFGLSDAGNNVRAGPGLPQNDGKQDLVNKQKQKNSKPMSLVESCFRSGPHSLSMTKSSHGGYQGYEIDFRGTGAGIDINANPFGSLSQLSVESSEQLGQDTSVDGAVMRSLPEPDFNIEAGMHISLQADTMQQMTTSPLDRTSTSKSVSDLPQNSNTDHEGRYSEGLDTLNQDLSIKGLTEDNTVEVVSKEPKKRGRKSKKAQTPSRKSNVAEDDDDVDELQQETAFDLPTTNQHKSNHNESYADTVDLDTQPHDTMKVASSKRKRSKRTISPEITEESPKKNPSSDLRLSDPAVIGEPKEMYKPRPSRSRAQKPVELGENLDGESSTVAELDQYGSQETSVRKESPKRIETQSKPAKKQAKKAKVKRAKTSAAALLSKTQEMLSEEEDKDVVWLESKPAKVVMELPPDINFLKTEEDREDVKPKKAHGEMKSNEDANDADDSKTQGRNVQAKKIIVDIPPLPKPLDTVEAPKAEPKKRGRKPKKKLEVEVEPVDDAPDHLQTDENQVKDDQPSTRQPLSEKDTNIQPPAVSTTEKSPTKDQSILEPSPSSTPQPKSSKSAIKPIHSPIKPSPTLASILVKPRVGLSRRSNIPSLLRKLDRSKEPPKTVEKKEKLTKKQKELEEKRRLECEGDVDADVNGDGDGRWKDRGDDGMLVEWND